MSEWNKIDEIRRFTEFWHGSPKPKIGTDESFWNMRAPGWDEELRTDEKRRQRSSFRISETADYLRSQGLLNETDTVIDIGCGPGRFAAEFAKTSDHVTGLDIASAMTDVGRRFAEENGIDNIDFVACDFKEADIDALGWRGKFDLVFASITPAMADYDALCKMEDISRGHCFTSNFVYESSPVYEAALKAAGTEPVYKKVRDGRAFYSIFNLLWLRGRFPTVRYFKEYMVEQKKADRELAAKLAERSSAGAENEEIIERILAYLTEHADENGMIEYPTEVWYGWILWSVNDSVDRKYKLGSRCV